MRAARAAGSQEATTAAASRTNAERTTRNAPGILTSKKSLPAKRAATYPKAAPARTPAAAITAPSTMTPFRRCRGCDPSASRMPNSRVRALTENAEHQRIQTVRREHLRADVFQSGSVLNGLIGGHFANNARDGRDERIRI